MVSGRSFSPAAPVKCRNRNPAASPTSENGTFGRVSFCAVCTVWGAASGVTWTLVGPAVLRRAKKAPVPTTPSVIRATSDHRSPVRMARSSDSTHSSDSFGPFGFWDMSGE